LASSASSVAVPSRRSTPPTTSSTSQRQRLGSHRLPDTNFGYVTSTTARDRPEAGHYCKNGRLACPPGSGPSATSSTWCRGQNGWRRQHPCLPQPDIGSAGGSPLEVSPRYGEDTAEILYTEEPPSTQRGAHLPRAVLVSADEQIRMSEPLFSPEDNVVMGNAPLFHILGQTCSWRRSCRWLPDIQPRINLDAAFDAIQRFRARTMIGVPTLYRMVLEHSRLDQYDLSSLEYCFSGGDVLPTDLGRRWLEKLATPSAKAMVPPRPAAGSPCAGGPATTPRKAWAGWWPARKQAGRPIELKEVGRANPRAAGGLASHGEGLPQQARRNRGGLRSDRR